MKNFFIALSILLTLASCNSIPTSNLVSGTVPNDTIPLRGFSKVSVHPDKLLKIILFAAVFELLFKHNNPKKVIISEYLLASEFFLEKVQIGYLNAILDKISKVLRKDE